MTPQQKQERREKIIRRLMDDIQMSWCKIQTHLNKQNDTRKYPLTEKEVYYGEEKK